MFQEINHIIDVLEAGGVILYPTDTIWGLGCDATNEVAVQKIFDIKQRALNKSMIVLLPDEKAILKYVSNPHPDIIDIVKGFSEPTTVIYENGIGFAPNVLAIDGSIGIRIVRDPFCKALLKRYKKPIVSTSANISGKVSPQIFQDIDEAVLRKVDYVVKYRQDDTSKATPSRIVKFDENDTLIYIR
jgi:L-threonylcarbamoyladenylate synthase